MTGRQISRLTRNGSRTTVLRSLTRLAELGVLDVAEAGRALMYSLNREHLATPAIESLIAMRRRMLEALREAVACLNPPPVSVTLFGSAARGDGDSQSDIDLLIVRAAGGSDDLWDEQMTRLSRRIMGLTGNRASVHCIGPDDLVSLAQARGQVVEEIQRDSVPLFGASIHDLLRMPG